MRFRAIAFALLVVFVLVLTAIPSVFAEQNPPIGLTAEELTRLDEIGINHQSTRDPDGEVRNPGEWEPSVGVIIRYPLGITIPLVAEMSEDLMVTTIVANSSYQTNATNQFTAGGVNMDNVQFVIAPTNTYWTRDYGPWFIFEDEQQAIVDHIYNRPRPYDDVIPQVLGGLWGLDVYGMDVIHTGGNHMSDGLGKSMSTWLVYNENPGLTHAEVDSFMLAYLGNDYDVLPYIESGGIHHIDCWAKFLSPSTILVKDVPASSPSYSLLNARADYLSQQISAWGQPYNIVRIYCPYGTAYTNGIILNNKVLVPIFNNSYDDDAIQTYQEAMPGYEILGFTGSWLDDDAIHCRVMGVPDGQMLFINHMPLVLESDVVETYQIGAYISAFSGESLISDSLKVYYKVDNNQWQSVGLEQQLDPDSFYAYIPVQQPGAEISYYIQAADNSGRVETHPYIGAPGAHRFTINTPPAEFGLVYPAESDTIYDDHVELVWQSSEDPNAPMDNVTYELWIDSLSSFATATMVDDNITDTVYTLTGLVPENDYFWSIKAVDSFMSPTWASDTLEIVTVSTGIDNNVSIPNQVFVNQNYPNPFNASTEITFGLSGDGYALIAVYDLNGRLVRTLQEGMLQAGIYHVSWNGIDGEGNTVASGVYLYKSVIGDRQFTNKMILLK